MLSFRLVFSSCLPLMEEYTCLFFGPRSGCGRRSLTGRDVELLLRLPCLPGMDFPLRGHARPLPTATRATWAAARSGVESAVGAIRRAALCADESDRMVAVRARRSCPM